MPSKPAHSPAAYPLVDATDIVRLVGRAAFGRAQAYAKNGAVDTFTWDHHTGTLTGVVEGTSARPYRCQIDLIPVSSGYWRLQSSNCSCPVGFDCKHVAATLLTSNAAHIELVHTVGDAELNSANGASAQSKSAGPKPPVAKTAARTKKATQTPPPESGWKSMMRSLAEPVGAATPRASAPGMIRAAPTPMAMQFELREQTPRTPGRWRGPTARPAAATALPTSEYRLGMRPLTRNDKGNWVRGTLTWNNLAWQASSLNLNREQHAWFRQFLAVHRAMRDVYVGQDTDWLYLDDFHSPLLWQLFDQAHRLGIQFMGSSKGSVVEFGVGAIVGLDATAIDDRMMLTTTLIIDERAHEPQSAAAIGTHGIYSYTLSPVARFTIASASEPLTAEQRGLLGRPAMVAIPEAEIDEFMTAFYPTMQQCVPLSSADGSVSFPELPSPTLVLTAQFQPKHELHLDWDWEYRAGDAVTRLPLRPALEEKLYRDPPAEDRLLDRLRQLGVAVEQATLRGLDAAEFAYQLLPRIAELDGVRIDVVGDKPDYRELTESPQLSIRTIETDQRDWFDLGVIVTVDGQDIPFGPLFTALAKGKDKLLLIDGSYLSLEQPEFERLHQLIAEAKALPEWETGVRISRYQASLWADFEDLAEHTEQAVSWRSAVQGLLDLTTLESTPLPSGVHATLRPYQQDGFAWLAFLWRHQLGGILADEMGLGKTLQTLALLTHATEQREDRRPFLVVAPTSVVSNWLSEAARFTPALAVRGITTTEAKGQLRLTDAVAGIDVVVTSYTLFRLDFEAYQAEEWAGLILDEAQFVKNHAARVHQCARDLTTPFKLAITGTPMENNLTELWALFAIVAPGLFPSSRKFTEDYLRRLERGDEIEKSAVLARLRRRIRPLMMRRTKELVATDLPAKQEQVLNVALAPRHRKIYDTFLQRERQKLLGLLDDLDKNRFTIFRSLTLLRMLSLDASLVDDKYASVPSSKLDALFEQLDDVVAEGHRSLIFSQFTSFLKKAAARLDEQGIPYVYLDGSTRRRSEVIASFKEGTAPVFLISLKAGGFGLNLTEADYVFLLDPWWNPATETQAIDRTHRIGQAANVMVYRLVAADTIEEKVMALKEHKARLFNAVMDEDAVFSSTLTADDIRGLFDG